MSMSNRASPGIPREVIDKLMMQARIARSKAVWSLLQSLFSRPESHKTDNADFSLKQPKLRLG